MGDDLSTGAKIGIGLVILCFLIAIVLALLMVVKNITNSGASQMESGLNQMMQTTYDDYDQTVVTGTKVKAAVKLFNGQNIAVVVNSHYNSAAGTDNKDVYLYGMVLDGFNKTAGIPSVDSTGKVYGEVYISTAVPSERADGVSYGGSVPTGKIEFNLNTRPMEASGTPAYVRDNAKYQSFLIKDSTDTIVGVYFNLAS